MKNKLFLIAVFCFMLLGCQKSSQPNMFVSPNLWMYADTTSSKEADVFFIAPTVVQGSEKAPFFDLQDSVSRFKMKGATNMEKGIYDSLCRFYAPYYQQISMFGYEQENNVRDSLLAISYANIRSAFVHYLKHWNNNRPIVLAGFSQGADHCIRLLKDQEIWHQIENQLIACYAIGWYLTPEERKQCPWLSPAFDESSSNSIILFSSEAPHITGSNVIIPADTWSYSINPLTWSTDTLTASADLNKGACFTNYDGDITKEIPCFCSAYIDSKRGALKLPDVNICDYPAYLNGFQEGEFHIYDYQFFYRNLQENVTKRVANFTK